MFYNPFIALFHLPYSVPYWSIDLANQLSVKNQNDHIRSATKPNQISRANNFFSPPKIDSFLRMIKKGNGNIKEEKITVLKKLKALNSAMENYKKWN